MIDNCWQVKDLLKVLKELPPDMRIIYEDSDFNLAHIDLREEDGEKILYIGSGAWGDVGPIGQLHS